MPENKQVKLIDRLRHIHYLLLKFDDSIAVQELSYLIDELVKDSKQPKPAECSHDAFVGDYCAVCDRKLPFGKTLLREKGEKEA